MSFDFHGSPKLKFNHQRINAETFVIPFVLEGGFRPEAEKRVLEIGCGEGGVLKAFTSLGCYCVGVDLSSARIESAKALMAEEVEAGQANFIAQNVYEADFLKKYSGQFDLILLKDAIEHIPEQEKFIPYLTRFLKPEGFIFFGFPPWSMPFGGHQQVCKTKLASKLPYYHLLPYGLFRAFLRLCGESDQTIRELLEVKDTGISTWRFEKILRSSGLKIEKKTFYLLNPIYRFKFNWSFAPIRQWRPLYYLPGIRDIFTMCVYYMVKPQKS